MASSCPPPPPTTTTKSSSSSTSPTSMMLEEDEKDVVVEKRDPSPSSSSSSFQKIPPSSNCDKDNNNNNNNELQQLHNNSCYMRPCLGHQKMQQRRHSPSERIEKSEVAATAQAAGTTGLYRSSASSPTASSSSSSAFPTHSYKSSSSSKIKPYNRNKSTRNTQPQQQQASSSSSSSSSSNKNKSKSNSNTDSLCLTSIIQKWTRIHETPIGLLCVLLFIVMCTSSIVVCIAVGRSKAATQSQEALDLAIETGEWFSNQLDQAILPLFSIAQFTHHLELFQKLPDKIGPANQPGSLPFVVENDNNNSNNNNDQPSSSFHRNVTGVCDEPELVSRFVSIASGVKRMANMDGILVNIQLAPYGVVCLLHPMNNTEDFDNGQYLDNTGAWGLDLFVHPNFEYIATQNIQQDTVGVAGPIKLIQCPTCDPFFIARLPIVDETHMISADGLQTYWPRWGFATALIDWSKLVTKSGIYERFEESEFEFQLTRTDQNLNPRTGEYEESTVVLAESFHFYDKNDDPENNSDGSEEFDSTTTNNGESSSPARQSTTIPSRSTKFVSTTLETTNNEWVMTVQYDTSTVSIWLAGVITASVVLSFFVSYLVYQVLRQKQRHSEITADTQAQQAMISTERNITAYFAHELRNPLSALDNALTTLRAGDNDRATTEELLDGMQLCTTFMSSIMNNLLDVRKIEEGHMTFRNQPMSLVELLEDSHRMMNAGVRDGVSFLVDTSNLTVQNTWVNADSHRIQQVLSNVLSNAIKYTLEGSITLTVSWVGITNDGGSSSSKHSMNITPKVVQFECIDTGPGIPKSEQEKLFERFVQRGGAPGTGLGLNIAKQIIEMMSGTIEFISDPTIKPGTTCRIIVPLEVIEHPEESSPSSQRLLLQQQSQQHYPSGKRDKEIMNGHRLNGAASKTGSTSGSTGAAMKECHPHNNQYPTKQPNNDVIVKPIIHESISILIMDDIKMNRTMLKRRLQKSVAPNAAYTLVSTGEEALEVCKHQTYDIIICDQYMDDAGGVLLGTDTIIAMRREGINSFIVGCSGNDLTDDFFAAGADIVWGKPMPSNNVIIAQFQDALRRSATRKRF